jgi:hypothetical protein
LPDPVDQEQRRHLLYPLLHRPKADQLTIEGSQDLADARTVALGGEVDRGLRAKQLGRAIPLTGAPGMGHRLGTRRLRCRAHSPYR